MAKQIISYKPASNLLAYDRWLQDFGRTPASGWRYRRRRWISTINIADRLYVTRDEVARFEARAAAGEFSKPHKTPNRKAADE
jgi:hypothetical protein